MNSHELISIQRIEKEGWTWDSHKSNKQIFYFNKGLDNLKIRISSNFSKRFREDLTFKDKFDFWILNRGNEVWVIPIELIGNTEHVAETFALLDAKWHLINHKGKKLLSELIDCQLSPSSVLLVGKFFETDKKEVLLA